MTKDECSEQMQEDIRTCMDGMWSMDERHLVEDMLCQIVVDNFKKLENEKWKKGIIMIMISAYQPILKLAKFFGMIKHSHGLINGA